MKNKNQTIFYKESFRKELIIWLAITIVGLFCFIGLSHGQEYETFFQTTFENYNTGGINNISIWESCEGGSSEADIYDDEEAHSGIKSIGLKNGVGQYEEACGYFEDELQNKGGVILYFYGKEEIGSIRGLSAGNIMSWWIHCFDNELWFRGYGGVSSTEIGNFNYDSWNKLEIEFCSSDCNATGTRARVNSGNWSEWDEGLTPTSTLQTLGIKLDGMNDNEIFFVDDILIINELIGDLTFTEYENVFTNEAHVSNISIPVAEYNTTSSEWDITLLLDIYQNYTLDPNQNELIISLYEYGSTTEITTTSVDVSKETNESISVNLTAGGVGYFLTNLFDEGTTFEIIKKFENASGTDPQNYTLKTQFYNSTTDSYKTAQTWNFNVSTEHIYLTEEEFEEQQKEKEEDISIIQRAIEGIGIGYIIENYKDEILEKFPFSWLAEFKTIWDDERLEAREESSGVKYEFTLPSSTEYFGSTTFTLIDFESVSEDYQTEFEIIKTILRYIILLSLGIYVVLRIKKFISSMQNRTA